MRGEPETRRAAKTLQTVVHPALTRIDAARPASVPQALIAHPAEAVETSIRRMPFH